MAESRTTDIVNAASSERVHPGGSRCPERGMSTGVAGRAARWRAQGGAARLFVLVSLVLLVWGIGVPIREIVADTSVQVGWMRDAMVHDLPMVRPEVDVLYGELLAAHDADPSSPTPATPATPATTELDARARELFAGWALIDGPEQRLITTIERVQPSGLVRTDWPWDPEVGFYREPRPGRRPPGPQASGLERASSRAVVG